MERHVNRPIVVSLALCIWPSTFDYKFQFRFPSSAPRDRHWSVTNHNGAGTTWWKLRVLRTGSAIAESSTCRPTGSCPPYWRLAEVRDRVWKRSSSSLENGANFAFLFGHLLCFFLLRHGWSREIVGMGKIDNIFNRW